MRKLLFLIMLLLPLNIHAQRARNIFEQNTLPTSGCTSLGQVIVDRATNKLYRCSVIGFPGKWTPMAEIPDIQAAIYNTCVDAGSNDSYACSLSPARTAYTTGQVVWFKANTANTGAATLNLNSLGAKTIKKQQNVDLADNDIKASQYVAVQYDGTNWQMISPVSNVSSGGITNSAGANVVTKSDGINIIASSITDSGSVISTTEPVGIGSTVTPPTQFTVFDTVSTSPRGLMSWQSSSDTSSAQVNMRKSRNTFAAPSVVVTGDILGRVIFSGYDGASYLEMGSIRVTATGTVASTRVPTKMEFMTGTDAAPSVLTTALTLDKDQSATFAGAVKNASGKTLAWNSTLTLAGTDSTTVNLGTVLATNFSGGAQVTASTTSYAVPPQITFSTTESFRQIIAPQAGIIKNLYVTTLGTQSNNNSMVVTVRTCTPTAAVCTGSNSTVTVTFAAGQTATTLSDTTHTVSVAAGDYISIGLANNANVGSAFIGAISFVFQ